MIKRFLAFLIFFVGLTILAISLTYSHFHKKPVEPTNTKAAEISLTFIEGWTNQDIAVYLEKNGFTQKDYFLSSEKKFDVSDYPLLNSKPASADLEGFLFPDTYRVFDPNATSTSTSAIKNTNPNTQLIEKMLNNFSLKFTPEMEAQAKKQKMTTFQIVTLASIIEKETGRNAVSVEQKDALDVERKMVSGIFYNRLKTGVALQSDATVNFITNKNTPSISDEDIQINSPYNTYKYKGLPPGPISNPSLSSLMAALYPTSSDYFYFLHKQPSGEPVYSKTFEEHIANKNKYLK